MAKNATTAFWTDSEALKSLIVLLAIIYMTIEGIVSPEVGLAAMVGQSGIYTSGRILKKTSEKRSEAIASTSNVKAQILEAIDEMKLEGDKA